MVRNLHDLYELIEQVSLEEIIMYYFLIYIFTGVISMIVRAEFEVSGKIKVSPKIVLGLILVYSAGGISFRLKSIYNFESQFVLLTVSLAILAIILILIRIVVFKLLYPSVFAMSLYLSNLTDHKRYVSETRLKVKRRFKHRGILNEASIQSRRYDVQIYNLIINFAAGLIVSVFLIRIDIVGGVFVSLAAFVIVTRDFKTFYKLVLKNFIDQSHGRFVESYVDVDKK